MLAAVRCRANSIYGNDGSDVERDAFRLKRLPLDFFLRIRRGLRSTTDAC